MMRTFAQRTRQRSAMLRVEFLEPRQMLAADVVINEIMYHPVSENDLEEFVELYNIGDEQADLSGWRLNRGAAFTIPDGTLLDAGQFLVIAADVNVFSATYGSGINVVGGWQGQLSNLREDVELEDDQGERVDLVSYADQGDWADRRLISENWKWIAPHDGGGRSAELINPAISNRRGQNWAASESDGGTPGMANSVASTDIAPMIRDTAHFPALPGPTDTVFVTAELIDELPNGLTAQVWYRRATNSPGAFMSATMFDDGQHNDGAVGDGLWGAALPAQPDNMVVEFYVQATDQSGLSRTWPAPTDESGGQFANAQYIVSTETPGTEPFYRLVLTSNELTRFDNKRHGSDAQFNVTFISLVDGEEKIRYNSGMRYRGSGSRRLRPSSVHLNFPRDHFWEGVRAINLNTQYVHAQLVGMKIFAEAGLPTEDALAVQIRTNAQNRATEKMEKTFGSYVRLEVSNNEFAENHFPNDSGGNLYKGLNGSLAYRGESESLYANRYIKQTNKSEADYSDIVALTRALNTSETPDDVFVETLEQIVDVHQWLRFLAVNTLLVNDENGLINGKGDDYALYSGVVDPRFVLLPHDMDTILNEGDTRLNDWDRNIFAGQLDKNPRLARLLHSPKYEPLFYAHLRQLADTVFHPSQLRPLLDDLLDGWVSETTIENMKAFAEQRRLWILSQIPDGTPELTGAEQHLRITELMYNPDAGEEHEFIELLNTSDQTLNLLGVRFSEGIDFTFPDIDLAAGEYIVVVRDTAAFEARYGTGINIAGEFSGKLANGGEQIRLLQRTPFEQTVHDFVYDDQWYPTTDGDGFSMVVIDPLADLTSWDDASNWRPSNVAEGSPGSDDVLPPASLVDITVSGESWSAAFMEHLESEYWGSNGFSVLEEGDGSASHLPWSAINQIRLQFNQPVAVNLSDVSLSGEANGAYSMQSVETNGNAATWTFTEPVSADRLLIDLSPALENLLGLGNTTATFEVLQGDTTQDGTVDGHDFAGSLSHQFTSIGDLGYDLFHDTDASGLINAFDLLQIRRALSQSLPPASSLGATVAQAPAAILARAIPNADSPRPSKTRLSVSSSRKPSGILPAVVDQVFHQPIPPATEWIPTKTARRLRRSATARLRIQVDTNLIMPDQSLWRNHAEATDP